MLCPCKVNIYIMDVHVFVPEIFSTDLSVRHLCVLNKCSVVFRIHNLTSVLRNNIQEIERCLKYNS